MKLRWLRPALADVERLHDFLARVDPEAAIRASQAIDAAPYKLLDAPRLGQRLSSITEGEVRRLLVGSYELRYQILDEEIIVLRVFHQREDRSR